MTLKKTNQQSADKDSYDVGYGKPPITTRFVKGQSGNPSGRPKGKAKTLHDIYPEPFKYLLREEVYRTLKVREGDSVHAVPAIQVILRRMIADAAQGKYRNQRLITQMVDRAEEQNHAAYTEHLHHAIEYKLIAEKIREQAREQGRKLPELYPNPDHLVFDNDGNVYLKGPLTTADKERDDWFRKIRADLEQAIKDLQREMKRPDYNGYLDRDLAKAHEMISLMIAAGINSNSKDSLKPQT